MSANLNQEFAKLGHSKLLLNGEFRPNEAVLQQYAPSDTPGIGPHRDPSGLLNLIVVLLLEGNSCFHICSDKAGRGSIGIPATPGDLILMRAQGFDSANIRPYHFVDGIRRRRLSLGMRELTSDPGTQRKIQGLFVT